MARLSLGLIGLGVVVSSLAMIAGCSTSEDVTADADQELIAGADATGSEFDAIGLIVSRLNNGKVSMCTGTLIAPTVVLTAKHCAMREPGKEGTPTNVEAGRVIFLIGARGEQHPIGGAQAIEATPSFLYRGGFTNLGSDVALYTLAQPIQGIEPLKVADLPPGPDDVNTPFLAVGYGIQDAAGHSGTRKKGQVTLRMVSGAPGPLAFPNADAYLAFMLNAMGNPPLTDAEREAVKQSYSAPLNDSYEVYAGGAAGDSQVCHGDSGGPLLRNENGKWVVHGVASTTMYEVNKVCQRGGMYAVFGASTRQLIASKVGDTCGVDGSTGQLACGLTAAPVCSILSTPSNGGAAPTPASAYVACLASSCCAEVSACFTDEACSTLSSCFNGCANDTACLQGCYAANGGVFGKYLAFQTCGRKKCATPTAAVTAASDGPSASQD